MNLLILVPGGVHRSGEIDVIPALLSLFKELAKQHRIFILATNQTTVLEEYKLLGCQVISLPRARLKNMVGTVTLVRHRLKKHQFVPDLTHSFWIGYVTLLGGILSKLYRIPLVATIAGGEPASIAEIGYGGSQTMRSRLLNRLSLSLSSAQTCGSYFVNTIARRRWNINSEMIPLGIDASVWKNKKPLDNTQVKWQVLQLASINRVKNPTLLLDVLFRLKESGFKFHLNWVGVDVLDGDIQRKAESMNLLQDITFYGFKTQNQLVSILAKQHFVIQSSIYESQGIAMAEAATQGACPIGTNVGWLADLDMGISASRDEISQRIAEQIIDFAENYSKRLSRVAAAQAWIAENDSISTAHQFGKCYQRLTLFAEVKN